MRKRTDNDQPPLASYWAAPVAEAGELDAGAPRYCIATTFEFDAEYFERELLPRFLGLKFDSSENDLHAVLEREDKLRTVYASVLVDACKCDTRQTTRRWNQIPIEVPGGCQHCRQHSKLTLLVWDRLARLIVSSANITPQGYRHNRELFAALDFFDGKDSVPLSVLNDALSFLEVVCSWARAAPKASACLMEKIGAIRKLARGWSKAPKKFRPRERPRVTFAATYPASDKNAERRFPARSALDTVISLWGSRAVKNIVVMTPFVGQRTDREDSVLQRLRKLRMGPNVVGGLLVPEVSGQVGPKPVVPLPGRFGECWQELFGENAYVRPIPEQCEGEARKRALHAKALMLTGENVELLMIGSSNFTPRGMGVGTFNCEANLIFEDNPNVERGGSKLDDRLRVIPRLWDDIKAPNEVVWQEPSLPLEETPPSEPPLPAFFAWATYSETKGLIRVCLDRTHPEPASWTIELPAASLGESLQLFSSNSCPADATEMSLTLEEPRRGISIIALLVQWKGQDDISHTGWLLVNVEDPATDLLPPQELHDLSLEERIDLLLSGRAPAAHQEKEPAMPKKKTGHNPLLDSLRAVDTSGYLLYRTRRAGRALAKMAERFRKTPATPKAFRYRLLGDPLGPVRFAEALADWRGAEVESQHTAQELGYRLFFLGELLVTLGHSWQQLHSSHSETTECLRPLFREARRQILASIEKMPAEHGALYDSLASYIDQCRDRSARLLEKVREK